MSNTGICSHLTGVSQDRKLESPRLSEARQIYKPTAAVHHPPCNHIDSHKHALPKQQHNVWLHTHSHTSILQPHPHLQNPWIQHHIKPLCYKWPQQHTHCGATQQSKSPRLSSWNYTLHTFNRTEQSLRQKHCPKNNKKRQKQENGLEFKANIAYRMRLSKDQTKPTNKQNH